MPSGEVRVDIVADASAFEKAIKKAEDSAKSFEKETDGLGETLDGAAEQGRGAADFFDGLASTMGVDAVSGAIGFSRGMADLADGLKTTVIPAITRTAASAKALSTTLLRNPYAIAAASLLAIGAAADASDGKMDAFGKTVQFFADGVKQWRMWFNDAAGAIGNLFGQNDNTAEQTANNLAASVRTVGTWADGSAGRLKNLYGAWVATTTKMQGNGPDSLTGPGLSISEWENVFDKQWEQILPAQAKSVKRAANKLAQQTKDAFSAVQPKLEAAAKKFADAMSLHDAFKDKFGLNFGDDIGHNVTESLGRQVATFERFAKKLADLRKMGLPEVLARQFAAAGPDALPEMDRINSGNIKLIRDLARRAEKASESFADAETLRETGVNTNKPIKVTLDVKGSDKELVNLIKKWVRTSGGGNVQVAFGGK